MTEHRRCGCPEKFKGLDCPACRGTGLIPPVSRVEWEAVVRERDEALSAIQTIDRDFGKLVRELDEMRETLKRIGALEIASAAMRAGTKE